MRPHAKLSALCGIVVLLASCSSGEGSSHQPQELQQRRGDASLPSAEGDDLLLRTRRERRVPGKPEWIASIDVDGDGALDVVSSTNSPGALMLWRGGRGTIEGMLIGDYPLRPTALSRGEGQPPLVAVASRSEDSVVLFDLATPGQAERVLELSLDDRPMTQAAGRVGDSGEKLWVVTRRGLLLRIGAGGLEHTQQLVSSVPRCASTLEPEVGLVVGFQETDSLEWYGPAEGGEDLVHRGSWELPGPPRDLLGLDVDGDGDQELICVEGEDRGWIFGLDGAELFATEPGPRGFRTTAIPIRLLSLPERGAGTWVVLASKGVACEVWQMAERGPRRVDFFLAGQTPKDFCLADSNGDGFRDFFMANRDALGVSVIRNDERGSVSPRSLMVGTFPNDIASGDFDGDGLEEAFVIDAKDQRITSLERTEGWLQPGRRLVTGRSPRAITCADVDGDGNQDLVWLERVFDGTRLNLLLGDGRGGLSSPEGFEPVPLGVGARDLFVESFGDDPRRFLVAADPEGKRLVWLHTRREGGGLATDLRGELSLPHPPRSIAAIHFGGVCRGLALAMPQSVHETLVHVYAPMLEEGGPLTWRLVTQTVVSGHVIDLETGDLDGDGNDDLVVLAANREGAVGGRVAPLLLEGFMLRPLGLLETGLRSMRILAEDFNGDGRAELVVANLDSHNVNVWLAVDGEQGGVDFRRLDDVGSGVGCIALAAPDLDGDGDPDLLVVDSANDGVGVIYNDTEQVR